jgi:hypothetical protein
MSERNEEKYTVRICPPGGVRAGIEGIIASDNNLDPARKLFRAAAEGNPRRLVGTKSIRGCGTLGSHGKTI